MTDEWALVEHELDRAGEAGETIPVWLRDDDAIAVTPALERLHRLCAAAAMPILLAVVPAGSTPALGAFVDAHPAVTPCQHGYAHINHAPVGQRACELGGGRGLDVVTAELQLGRARLQELFGIRLSDCLVPPWNRIEPSLIPLLRDMGFDRLSVFGPPGDPDTMPRLNADLDIIDWRHGRAGRSLADVAGKLATLIASSRRHGRPVGLLTHHLAHDDTAWSVLETALTRLRQHPAVAFVDVADLS